MVLMIFIVLLLFIIFISYIIFILYDKDIIISKIYACVKTFNNIPSSKELQAQLETAQRYIFLKILSRQRLKTCKS